MLDAHEAIVIRHPILEWRSHHAKRWFIGKLAEQEGEIVRVKRDIGIQAADYIVWNILHGGVTDVEGLHFSGEMSFATFRHAHQFDPRMVNNVSVDDVVRTVGRAVADD